MAEEGVPPDYTDALKKVAEAEAVRAEIKQKWDTATVRPR